MHMCIHMCIHTYVYVTQVRAELRDLCDVMLEQVGYGCSLH